MFAWKAHPQDVRGLAFAPDGRRLATFGVGDDSVRVWDPVGGRLIASFQVAAALGVHHNVVYCIAFSRCGAHLAVGAWTSDRRESVRVWECATQSVAASLHTPAAPLGLAFTPDDPPGLLVADGTRLNHFANVLGADDDPQPVVHNRGPDRKAPKCSRVLYSDDLKWVATNGRPKAVVWDAGEFKPRYVREHPKGPQNGPAAFDPAGERLAVAHGTKVDVWRFADATAAPVELVGHKLPVWAAGFLPDGHTVQTAASDGTVRLWDANTGAERKRFDFGIGKLFCAAFAPDGLTCAAGGAGGQVVVWDVDG